MGRSPIGKTAMLPAERKRRERTKIKVAIEETHPLGAAIAIGLNDERLKEALDDMAAIFNEQTRPLGAAMTTGPNDERFKEELDHIAATIREKEIELLLSEAQPRSSDTDCYPHDTEQRRIEAVRQLRALHQIPPVRARVRDFFAEKWAHILQAPDPAAAAAEFFNGKRRRGPQPVSKERNLRIARAVQKHVDAGMTIEEACKEARLRDAPSIGSWERIREIYYGPTTDEQAKKDWRHATGALNYTVIDILLSCEPVIRTILEVTNRDPEQWLDFLVNGADLS